MTLVPLVSSLKMVKPKSKQLSSSQRPPKVAPAPAAVDPDEAEQEAGNEMDEEEGEGKEDKESEDADKLFLPSF